MEITETNPLNELIDYVRKEHGYSQSSPVIVEKFKEVLWNDASLGIRNLQQFSAQAISSGYECVLIIGVTKFFIHADKELKNISVLPACKPVL